ncbi:C-C chemokine receptor type 7 [Dunckerocampus dactyliophorus]|uniref:C-C chemokine receptor type 7 n=1 Tax=Dunckerocampus dactyliophorus TaxID=161453 RepID=UPI002404FD54|nr:C-C chemokine receptor type 7 [Dunckerocampus dactyliophorus]
MTFVSDVQRFLPLFLIWSIIYKPCLCQNGTEDVTDYTDSTFDYSGIPEFCDKVSNHQFRLWFMPPFFSVTSFTGLVGNLLVIFTFIYFNRLKTMTDVYLLNLAFADLLFALSLPLWAVGSMAEWTLELAVCKIMHTVYKVTTYSSMFLLCFISMDRYFAIAKAVSAHRLRSQAVLFSKVSSAAVWILSLIVSTPEMKYAKVINNSCTTFSSNADPLRFSIQTSQIVLAFVLPLLVMSFCYSRIVHTLCQTQNFERNKAVKVILVVVVVFVVCQAPYNVVLFWTTVVVAKGGTEDCSYENNLLYATDATQCVAFLRCSLNPFVYAFIGVKFRHDLLRLMKKLGCLSQERFLKYTDNGRGSCAALDTDTTATF